MIQNTRHKDLIIAWLNGAEIEVFKQATKRWEIVHSPSFIEDYDYRIKSKEVRFSGLRVDYFNIQVYVHHWARWIACDKSGYINVYSEKPDAGWSESWISRCSYSRLVLRRRRQPLPTMERNLTGN